MTGASTTTTKSPARDKSSADKMQSVPPLKARRGLFILFVIIFSLWVATMIVMYFATVRPRHQQPPTHAMETSESVPH